MSFSNEARKLQVCVCVCVCVCVTLKHFISLIGSIWHALQDCYDRCCLHHDMPSAPARDPLGPLPLGHLLKCSAPQFHGL